MLQCIVNQHLLNCCGLHPDHCEIILLVPSVTWLTLLGFWISFTSVSNSPSVSPSLACTFTKAAIVNLSEVNQIRIAFSAEYIKQWHHQVAEFGTILLLPLSKTKFTTPYKLTHHQLNNESLKQIKLTMGLLRNIQTLITVIQERYKSGWNWLCSQHIVVIPDHIY